MRYLSGELPAQESEEFEARLADDLAAAEALSRAVLLQESLAACASDLHHPALILPPASLPVAETSPGAKGWRERTLVRRLVYGMLATLSAAVLFAVGWIGRGALGLQPPEGSELTLTTSTGVQDASMSESELLDPLLSAWILLADDEPMPTEEPVFDLGVEPPIELVEASERGVPAWMIAALLTSSEPAPPGEGLPAAQDPEWEEL
jgi:hypothetical protein